MTIDYEKLFEPYTRDGHTLENSIRWLKKVAEQGGIKRELADLAIELVFMEVAGGKAFPLDKCPCGCGIDKAGTAITHAMRDRMFALDEGYQSKFKEWLNKEHNRSILEYIERENAKYIAEVMPKELPNGILRRIYWFLNKPRLVSEHWRYK